MHILSTILYWYLFLCIIWFLVYATGYIMFERNEEMLEEYQDFMSRSAIYNVLFWLFFLVVKIFMKR